MDDIVMDTHKMGMDVGYSNSMTPVNQSIKSTCIQHLIYL